MVAVPMVAVPAAAEVLAEVPAVEKAAEVLAEVPAVEKAAATGRTDD
jgi:hypothetical protein